MKKLVTPTPIKIGLAIVILSVVFYLLKLPFFNFIELKTLDLRFISRGVRSSGGETVIAAIDEKSLSELGRWPWKRTVIADLVDRLKSYGVRAVGFDVVFAEPDEQACAAEFDALSTSIDAEGIGGGRIDDLIAQIRREADTDGRFAQSIKNADNVILGYFFHTARKEMVHLSDEEVAAGEKIIRDARYQVVKYRGAPRTVPTVEALAVAPNIPQLSEAAAHLGFFNTFPDVDGRNRWFPLIIKFRDNLYPALPIATLERFLDWPPVTVDAADYGVRGVNIGDVFVPTDEAGRILLNFLGPIDTFPVHSIADIVNGRLDPSLFKDKIVLVGATATGIYDLRVTPFSTTYPGIGVHATVIDNILHGNFLRRPEWTALIDIAVIAALGLLMIVLLERFRVAAGIAVTVLVVAIFAFLNRYVFAAHNLWLNATFPVLTIIGDFVGITIYRYLTEEREKRKIRGAFQYYLTSSVINEMLKDPAKLKLGGDKKDLTVFFSDIRGFTSISEALPPEELVKLLNEYLTAMTNCVFKYEGLLDKYIGDSVMAVWGAPLDQPDHTARACETALDMMAELHRLQKKWAAEGRPFINIGIGINSGDMVVGNMGSEMRFDYTVMGDAVNLASRLEGINKEYGTNIVVSEGTFSRVNDRFFFRELDAVRVKGKEQPVRIFELLCRSGEKETWKDMAQRYATGLDAYRGRRFDEAMAAFRGVLEIRPEDAPAKLYIERCEDLKKAPPGDDWDGVFRMTKK
ncbi:MAG: adenylate/guanylate cyclase domain-containing protein [Deltaproteobacteria bacterium]|nr:adenylate/guanylate cyclase domain-containing protein [Deltaproteobacteria bacterium]